MVTHYEVTRCLTLNKCQESMFGLNKVVAGWHHTI